MNRWLNIQVQHWKQRDRGMGWWEFLLLALIGIDPRVFTV
jgi:hypothetical protein